MKQAPDDLSVSSEDLAQNEGSRKPLQFYLHQHLRSCIFRRIKPPFMLAHREYLLLVLAVLGVVGCSSMERWYDRAGTNSSFGSQPGIAQSSAQITPQPAEDSGLGIVSIHDAEPKRSTDDEIPAHVLKHFQSRPEFSENQEDSVSTSVLSEPEPSAAELRADKQLLEFLQNDLEKAVDQPQERRRLLFSKQVINHPRVRHFVKHYSTKAKHQFETGLARSGKFISMISKVLVEEGLPEEFGYLALVESEYLVNARSHVGAVGLWQFVPATARQYGLRIDRWVDERRDPIKSTRAAAAYLRDLHGYYGRWCLATAAYNAGPGIIDKALKSSRARDFWGIRNKSRLKNETRNFVPKFIATALIASDPKKYGFSNIPYQDPLEFDEVKAEGLLRIEELAEMAESDPMTIKYLNPALLRKVTPPEPKGYSIRVPVGKSAVFAKANDSFKGKSLARRVVTHRVKRGDTLSAIGRYYGQAVKKLMQLNGLTSHRIKIGQRINIFLEGRHARLR